MVSFRTTLLALAGAVAVSADYWIDPESVSMADRTAWCNDQRSTCPVICLQTSTGDPVDNTCNPENLTYGCVCSDGKTPNMTEYTLTLPYHTCREWGRQCQEACGAGNNECASSCVEDHPCGAQEPQRVNKTTTTTMPATTSEPKPTNQIYDSMGGEGSNDDNESAAGLVRFGDSYGLAVVAGGLFAGVAMLL